MSNGTEKTFRDIQESSGRCISKTIAGIQKSIKSQKAPATWIRDLECLSLTNFNSARGKKRKFNENEPERKRLDRVTINPFKRSYIAISYPWEPSDGEPQTCDRYAISTRGNGGSPAPNKVRDSVLDRAVRYAEHYECPSFWIDYENIDQDNKDEKETAVQSMDQVYKYAERSIALLWIWIESVEELDFLADLLKNQSLCSDPENSRRQPISCYDQRCQGALELLDRITSDNWWQRAWTYQEDYLAGPYMKLLVRHHPKLQRRKSAKLFGNIPGELAIDSTSFREAAATFCTAHKASLNKRTCQKILQRAPKYEVRRYQDNTANAVKPMFPLIFKDISSRDITYPSDRLAITANCCSYSIRINIKPSRRTRGDSSIYLLVLALLNGEVLVNTDDKDAQLLDVSVFRFLENHCVAMDPLVDKQLTFQKSCRFQKVRLSSKGIRTQGHIWRIGERKIDVDLMPGAPFQKGCSDGESWWLTGRERWWLERLARHLRSGNEGKRFRRLSKMLHEYHQEDLDDMQHRRPPTSWGELMTLMAREVVDAMKSENKILRLGARIRDLPDKSCHPYTGIFVVDAKQSQSVSYAFTSFEPARKRQRSLDKHVSLLVMPKGNQHSSPSFVARGWISGLCFFSGEQEDEDREDADEKDTDEEDTDEEDDSDKGNDEEDIDQDDKEVNVVFRWPKSFTVSGEHQNTDCNAWRPDTSDVTR